MPKRAFTLISTITLLLTTIFGQNLPAAAETDDPITNLNQQLLQSSKKRFFIFSPDMTKLESIAAKRKKLLLEEIKKDPKSFLGHTLPQKVRESLPRELEEKGLIEKNIELQGKVQVLHFDDFEGQKSKTEFRIKDYNLRFTEPAQITTDDQVWVRGVALDSEVAIDLTKQVNLQTITRTTTRTAGEFRMAVLLFNFPQDRSQPYTKKQVEDIVFNAPDSVNAFYQENSFGQVTISGDVFGWFEIEASSTTCDLTTWKAEVRAMAAEQGIDLEAYDRVAFLSVRVYSCFGTGAAGVDEIWVNGLDLGSESDTYVFIHELGHTFGLPHSNLLECGNPAVDEYTNCRVWEYYNRYDTMGGSYSSATYTKRSPHFNAVHKIELGWIPPTRVEDVISSGTYRLYALGKETNKTQVLRLPKYNSHQFYYLEYRLGSGFDASLPETITDGVLINIWHSTNNSINGLPGTFLVDAHPSTKFSETAELDESLKEGSTFIDQINGITIRQLDHNSQYATISISLPEVASECPENLNPDSRLGKAVYFNEHTYIRTVSPNSLQENINGDFTIEAWIKPELKETYEGIAYLLTLRNMDVAGEIYSLSLGIPQENNPANLRFRFGETSPDGGWLQSDYIIPLDDWTHIAAVKAQDMLKIFINGEQVASRPFVGISPYENAVLHLGGWVVPFRLEPLYSYRGAIDDLRISNVARDIAQNWQNGVYENPLEVDTNTLALWRFEENMLDDSGNENNGVAVGNICFTEGRVGPPPSPDFGTALKFDYQNIYGIGPAFVEIDSSEKLLMKDNFTVEVWIKPAEELINPPSNAPQNPRFILAKEGIPDEAWGYSLDVASRKLEFGVNLKKDDGTHTREIVFGQTELQPNHWYFVQAIRDGTKLSLYLNGNLEGTKNIPADVSEREVTPLTIGCAKMRDFPTCLSNFYGEIDEIRVSNSARSDHQPPSRPFLSDQNTIALWHFDQNALDATANDFDGESFGDTVYVPSTAGTSTAQAVPQEKESLITDWNRLKSFSPDTASAQNITESLSEKCDSKVLAVSRLNRGFWETFVTGYGGVDFTPSPGQPFYVKLSQPCQEGF